jgi:hypothetical protein
VTSVCGSAEVSFTAPDLADGTYYVLIVDSAGDQVYPGACDPGDTADTGGSCGAALTVTYGGGA